MAASMGLASARVNVPRAKNDCRNARFPSLYCSAAKLPASDILSGIEGNVVMEMWFLGIL